MSRYSSASSEDEELKSVGSRSVASGGRGVPCRQSTQPKEIHVTVPKEFAQIDLLRGMGDSGQCLRTRALSTDGEYNSCRINGLGHDTTNGGRTNHPRNRSFSPPTSLSQRLVDNDPFNYEEKGAATPQRRKPRRVSSRTSETVSQRRFSGQGSTSPRRQTHVPPVDRNLSRSPSPMTPKGMHHQNHMSIGRVIDHELLARAGFSIEDPNEPGSSSTNQFANGSQHRAMQPKRSPRPQFRTISQQSIDSDEDLARRMQNLEDRGMGRLNSDRALETMSDSDNDLETACSLHADAFLETQSVSNEVSKASSGLLNDHGPIPFAPGAYQTIRIPLSPKLACKVESAPEQRCTSSRIPSPIPPPSIIASTMTAAPIALQPYSSPSKQRKKRMNFLSKLTNRSSSPSVVAIANGLKTPPSSDAQSGIPAHIPPPPGGSIGASRSSSAAMQQGRSVSPNNNTKTGAVSGIPKGIPAAGIHGVKPSAGHGSSISFNGSFRGTSVCAACGMTHGPFLKAFDRLYHPECFRCKTCAGKIEQNDQFRYTVDSDGRKHPHHRECFMSFGVKCVVCKHALPMTAEGRVPFIKHPFFDDEKMCMRHADEPRRRCAGCQRFEPNDAQFIDIMDGDRCVCPACCRSAIVDNADAKPLWNLVLDFFQTSLKLPVWGPLRDLPILLVGSETLHSQMRERNLIHGSSSHPLTAGMCLTEPMRRGNEVPRYSSSSSKQKLEVISILCLTGLPRDLTASVLAHEAAHAWIKMHPKYDLNSPLPAQVEEGVAQLVAFLFLSDGLGPTPKQTPEEALDGPSDEKLRQYFKFTIERETSDVYGTGYRRAAVLYRDIGIEALLTHIMQYRDFPVT